MSRRAVLGVALTLMMQSSLEAQTYDWSALTARLHTFVPSVVPGLTIAITRNGQVIYLNALGNQTVDTVLPVASSTKMPAALTILTLVDAGLLDLDRPVSVYIGSRTTWPADKAAITMRMLLNHTAGVDHNVACVNQPSATLSSCAGQVGLAPLRFTPGTRVDYGAAGYLVAAFVAESVTGQTWSDLFAIRIAAPLTLRRFSFPAPNPRLANGALTDAGDYVKILEMFLAGGMHGGRRVLSRAMIDEMKRNQVAASLPRLSYPGGSRHPGYSFGWWIADPTQHPGSRGPELSNAGALGNTPWVDLDLGYGVELLINRSTSEGDAIRDAIRPLIQAQVKRVPAGLPFQVPANGVFAAEAATSTPAPLTGTARITVDSASRVEGAAIMTLRREGVPVSETTLPLVIPLRSVSTFVETGTPARTGIAVTNTGPRPATVQYTIRSPEGSVRTSGEFVVDVDRQLAFFVDEVPMRMQPATSGVLTLRSTELIGAVAFRGSLNDSGDFIVSSQPAWDADTLESLPVGVPHLAVGGGWTTRLVVINPEGRPISGRLTFQSPGSGQAEATPLRLRVGGVDTSDVPFAIASGGFAVLDLHPPDSALQVGSVEITPATGDPFPWVCAMFSFSVEGTIRSETSVAASTAGRSFRLYVESSGSEPDRIRTGFAISNPGTDPVTAQVRFLSTLAGVPEIAVPLSIPPRGQRAMFIDQIPGLPELTDGVLAVTAPVGVRVAGLRSRETPAGGLLLSTLPVFRDSTPQSPLLVLPQMAAGGGYSTRVLLTSDQPTASGVIRSLDSSGQPWNALVELPRGK